MLIDVPSLHRHPNAESREGASGRRRTSAGARHRRTRGLIAAQSFRGVIKWHVVESREPRAERPERSPSPPRTPSPFHSLFEPC